MALLGFEPRSLPLGGAVLQTAWWTITINAITIWSGERESNPHLDLGRMTC